MLVISRKADEAVMIGDGVEVRVLRVGGHGVKLGITAPSSVTIHRLEIYEQIRAENRAAARAVQPAASGLAEQLRAYLKNRSLRSGDEAIS